MSYPLAQGDFPLAVSPQSILWGDHLIPTGTVKGIFLPNEGDFRDSVKVTLWTEGGMGKKRKQVSLTFECETVEKATKLFNGIQRNTSASFPLNAVRFVEFPVIEIKNSGYMGGILFTFINEVCCKWFTAVIAPFFFHNFEQIPFCSTLKCTYKSPKKVATEAFIKRAIHNLNRRTNNRITQLQLASFTPDLLDIYKEFAPPKYDASYEVSLEEIRIKENGDLFTPLPVVSQKKILQLQKKYDIQCERLSTIKKLVSEKNLPEVIELESCLEAGYPRNTLEFHIMKNLSQSLVQKIPR